MTISSRTPEGEPARCPMCQSRVVIEPSLFFGDATCPNCGQLIWFIRRTSDNQLFANDEQDTSRAEMLDAIAKRLGVTPDLVANNPSLFHDIGADSLDIVELVMELEEEFDLP